jgi:hypothetical protein
LAHAPIVTMDPIGPLSYATFPQVYNVTGAVCHSDPGNVSGVTDVTLLINTVQEGTTFNPNAGNDPCDNFSLPWNITGAGSYNVVVTARHGNALGQDSEVVVVSSTTVVVAQCKAAPAVAAALLKDHSVKPKAVNNYISQVAHQMGPQTDFNGVEACSEAAYRTAVDSYLDITLNAY